MFTGLISEVGTVTSFERDREGAKVTIEAPATSGELEPGGSVAVSGVCLTATRVAEDCFDAEISEQTLRSTRLGELTAGDAVNLELPLRPNDRLGGHIVQGHIDGTATVTQIAEQGFSRVTEIAIDPALTRFVVDCGSVAIDGVSLTVAAAKKDAFTVALIPETIERTTLGELKEGDHVNFEADIVAKYVEGLARG